ncbi:MAG: hypothetical protein WC624_02880 [Candidatus Margulisiibacteriota bacterium]
MLTDVGFQMTIAGILSRNPQRVSAAIKELDTEKLKMPEVRAALVCASYDSPAVRDLIVPMLKEVLSV